MTAPTKMPSVVNQALEIRQFYGGLGIDQWAQVPNPYLASLFPKVRTHGVILSDVAFYEGAKNLGEVSLNIDIRRLKLSVQVFLDGWKIRAKYSSISEELIALMDDLTETIRHVAGTNDGPVKADLRCDVVPGPADFSAATASLVDTEKLGPGQFFGFVRYRADSSLSVDRSSFNGGAEVNVSGTFPGSSSPAEVVEALYRLQFEALALLGVSTPQMEVNLR